MGGIIVNGKELPKIVKFTEVDFELYKALTAVFEDFGLKGKLMKVEFDCGTPPPPPPKLRCYRVCTFGPDDRPICTWVCY